MSKLKKCNKDDLEYTMAQIFVGFFIVGAFILLAIIPVSIFIGGIISTILIAAWVAVWGLSFVVFLAWPYIRWITTKVYEVIKDS
jgi:hypothetical protein